MTRHPWRIAWIFPLLVATTVVAQRQAGSGDWPAATPASVGLDAKVLTAFDADIAGGTFGYVDSLLVVRHGKAVLDRTYPRDYDRIYGEEAGRAGPLNAHDPTGPFNYFNPWWHPFYRRGHLHSLQSVTKTITSVIIGVATTRGDFPAVDTPILSFFDERTVSNVDDRKRRVTIRHLLTMTGGFDWNESLPYTDPENAGTQMEASPDWVQFTINRRMAREPGTTFNYSSGESALLAHVFRAATGRDIEEYAATHLFAPLGIREFFWKRGPSGLADTEGGLYLDPHDLARIMQLYLKAGLWQGRRLVSEDWVKASVRPAVDSNRRGVKYGYKWWLYPYGEKDGRLAWCGAGFGGQFPIIFPDLDMVVVLTGWNILGGGITTRIAIERILAAVRH
jgi:CubicO group peptidase (beta-lactamase class C family)